MIMQKVRRVGNLVENMLESVGMFRTNFTECPCHKVVILHI